jgi:hypothetical protein
LPLGEAEISPAVPKHIPNLSASWAVAQRFGGPSCICPSTALAEQQLAALLRTIGVLGDGDRT